MSSSGQEEQSLPSWATGLQLKGNYFHGIVENLESVLDRHRIASVTTYGVRKSRKNSAGVDKENLLASKEPRLFWRKQEDLQEVSFDGVPFSVKEEKILDCQYGPHYFKKRSPVPDKAKRLRLQGTRKIGCLARVSIKKYVLYPEYKRKEDLTATSREIKQRKRDTLEALKKSLSDDSSAVKTQIKYYVSLPCETAHTNHPTGEAAGFAQKLHPLVISKISDMVSAGITNITDIKRSLRWFVRHEVAKQIGEAPKLTDRSLYPTDTDIRNHVHIAKKSMEFSKLDQEQLQFKLLKWKTEIPSQHVHYRPYVEAKSEEEQEGILSATSEILPQATSSQIFDGNSGVEQSSQSNDCLPSVNCSQKFLLVLQEDWQKKLLQRYGNTICLIDATYKTTLYDLPLYFICVKTNVGYTIVAEFIIQSEEHEHIQEALEILKMWNPEWCPSYFMCDYSEAELLALEAAFTGVVVYLCDFHREQCWERWVKGKQNGPDALTREEAEDLLALLRCCATAPPCTITSSSLDFYFQEAVKQLKQSSVWKNHKAVQFWLDSKWLNIPKRWARAYRDLCFHAAVDTNNGVESQNKVLKYKYLPRRKTGITLSYIVTLLIEEFLPDVHQKYQFENFQMSSDYRTYYDFVPSYLRGRPPKVVRHCMERKLKARKFSEADVCDIDATNGKFSVSSSSGKCYEVDFGLKNEHPSCDCQDWIRFHLPCKHFFAVFSKREEWQWSVLPSSYLHSAYLSQDKEALMIDREDNVESKQNLYDEVVECSEIDDHQSSNSQCYDKLPKQTSCSTSQLRRKVLNSLKTLESLVYLAEDTHLLSSTLNGIQKVSEDMRKMLPDVDGLLLRPVSLSERARKIKQKYYLRKQKALKFRSLESSLPRGRKKEDSKFRGRVGRKANRLRKLSLVSKVSQAEKPETQLKVQAKKSHQDKPKMSASQGRKRKRCNQCDNCLREDCRTCNNCLDMKKYGGRGVKKQCCRYRKCTGSSKPAVELDQGSTSSSSVSEVVIVTQPDQFLAQFGRQVRQILGDGNCMFRALSYQVLGNENEHITMRNFLVRFENSNPSIFESRLISGEGGVNLPTLQEHIHHMMRPRSYGTHVELEAAATYYQVPIYICTKNRRDDGYHWEVIKPLCGREKLHFPFIDETAPSSSLQVYSQTHFELLYRGCHYDCITAASTAVLHNSEPSVQQFDLDSIDLTQ